MLAFHLQTDADPDLVPDPVYHFDADPKADPYFYLMRIRIQVSKMMRIRRLADQDFYLMRIRIQVTKMMRIRMRIRMHNTEWDGIHLTWTWR